MISALAGLAAGALLGLVCFGGLWLTLSRLRRADRPRRLLAVSLAGRLAAAAAGLGLLAAWGPVPTVSGLVGLLGARQALLRRIGTGSAGHGPPPDRDGPARRPAVFRKER